MREWGHQPWVETPPSEGFVRSAEDSFYKLAELNPDAVLVVFSDRIEFINAGGLRLLHLESIEQVMGRSFYNLFHADHRTAVRNRIDLVVKAGMLTAPLKEQVVAADGAVIDVEVFAAAFRMQQGDAVQIVLHDVTERTRAEELRRISAEQLQLFIEHAPVALAMFDREMRYVGASRRWLTEFVAQPSEVREVRDVRGRSHYEVSPEIPERWRAVHRRGLAGEEVRDDNDRFERPDGSIQWLRWQVRPWYDARGTVGGIVIFGEDTTERKRAEESLRQSRELLQCIIDSSESFIYVLDPEGRFILLNRGMEAFFRVGRGELIGKTRAGMLPEPIARQHRMNDLEVMRSNQPVTFEEDTHEADGMHTYLSAKFPVRDAAGRVFAVGGISTDITQRRRVEEQMTSLRDELAHAGRLGTLGELASGLAHELSQPLASLHLYAGGALKCASPAIGNELRQCLEAISTQALRAGEIVRRMRSFARPGVTQRAGADANRLIREVLPLLDNLVRHNHVKTVLELADDALPVFVDAIQIQQVLVNVIRNAVEAMTMVPADARRLSIRSERSGEGVRISVTDTGHGIDPSIAARLFHPFQTTKPSGLGLGLTISRTLVEAHNGRIGARPDPAGGTEFWLVLPAASGESDP